MGYIGFILRAIKINMDTYYSKITKIEERLAALESPTE